MAEVTSLVAGFFGNSSVSKAIADLENTVKSVFVSNNVPVQQTMPQSTERIISMKEVSWHDEPGDCWVIIFDKVYDVTKFLNEVGTSIHFHFFHNFYKINFFCEYNFKKIASSKIN